ncbi:hypothetical protein BJ875DRAFT_490028 [Amylocarpus encephaloides]|uniref:Protein kinase domain-containing protein n=1 Tax=Amylocarpus encephaloides TaxID=45428 RepID=A0A9P7Y6W4_9HELO|nr:hypothetical protein BJ875DRAFT_490028 [Amylocarpus encephaloides]
MAEGIRRCIENEVRNMSFEGGDEWFPSTYSKELLGKENIEAVLKEAKKHHPEWKWKSTTSDLTAFVRDNAPKLFTMLVYHQSEKMLDQFCGQGMDDSMFPVNLMHSKDSIESTNKNKPKKLQFEFRFANDVCGWQWEFFVPELSWTTFDHPPLAPKTKLPFLKFDEISRTGFSVVYKGVVHRAHIITSNSKDIKIATDEKDHPYVAVKELLQTGLNIKESESFIQAEYQTLERLRHHETPHLIKAIAFYKTKKLNSETLYFVFPWAEHGNLRQFWQQKTPRMHDNSYMKWIFVQLVGLADAIYTLHHEGDRSCRHGDLKPENVLCFNSSRSTVERDQTSCILVISDVGLSKNHDRSTEIRSKSRNTTGETVTYAAPETALFPERPTSRRYDIWSLGCLYLEFVIWILYGIEGLNRFGKEIGRSAEGRFYIITSSTTLTVTGGKTPQVNPVVTTWMEHIKQDPRCTGPGSKKTAIGRLVTLIEKRLLVVTSNPDPKDLKVEDEDQVTAASGERTDVPKLRIRQATMYKEPAQSRLGSQASKFANTGEERAYAPEVHAELEEISRDANAGDIKWLNKDSLGEASFSGPKSSTNLPVLSRGQPADRNDDLDDTWEYIPDKDVAQRLQATWGQLPQSYPPSELCERCDVLALWSQKCTFDDTATMLAKRSVGCALCRLLSRALKAWEILPDDNLHFFRTGSYLKFNSKWLPPIASLYTMPESNDALESNVQLGFPKLPDPGSLMHVEVLRQWIQDCDDTHQCLQSQDVPFLPTRLLYVGKRHSEQPRLICKTQKLSKGTKYLALSHRWGSHPKEGEVDPLARKIVCTYKRNIDEMEHGVDMSSFPPMYQDAIKIARDLKVDYLWLDSLCIIQRDGSDPLDQGEDWKAESERMEQVYRSAYLTIAASCTGSPEERFLKTRPERQCVAMHMDTALYYLCDPIDDFSKDVEQGELNKRGWVLQERALSRRTIYFSGNQTYWECGEGVRCETLTKTKNSKASLLGDANFPYSIPNYVKGKKIVLYQDLYERYSKLALSFNTDRPVAIRGLEKRLTRALGSQGRFGVLDIYLRRGLLWQRDEATLERIDFSGNTEQEPIPSWSWMAYAGGIRYMNVPFGGAEWAEWEQDIVKTWKKGRNDNNAVLELEVLVRDLKDIKPGTLIFRDEPSRNFDFPFKCVIVGSSNASNQSKGQVYYVLIVTLLSQREAKIYERTGVACLHKQQIAFDKPETKAYMR